MFVQSDVIKIIIKIIFLIFATNKSKSHNNKYFKSFVMLSELIQSVSLPSSSSSSARNMCIIGSKMSGKTNFAFQLARETAEKGSSVLVVCVAAKLEHKFPLPLVLEDEKYAYWPHSILNLIDVAYVSSHLELKAQMASLQSLRRRPGLVIIEDLSDIIDPLRSVQRSDPSFLDVASSTLAHISDAVKSINALAVLTESSDERLYLHYIARHIHFFIRKSI